MSKLIEKIIISKYFYNRTLLIANAIKKGQRYYFSRPFACGINTMQKIIILRCGMKIPRKIKKKIIKGKLNKKEKNKLIKNYFFYYTRKVLFSNSITSLRLRGGFTVAGVKLRLKTDIFNGGNINNVECNRL